MNILQFIFLVVIAAIAAIIAVVVERTWPNQPFAKYFALGLFLLILPALLPLFIHP